MTTFSVISVAGVGILWLAYASQRTLLLLPSGCEKPVCAWRGDGGATAFLIGASGGRRAAQSVMVANIRRLVKTSALWVALTRRWDGRGVKTAGVGVVAMKV